ncbi:hypothetical protein [Aureispira sp. CCB-QB1]|uniref:hypothetical protein n=1 Tax=Aureispira sp. CCB-QB1 TaxID=1313421 RepID=UPI000697AD93|nr:hypothetical protein [Aureispira sp. CCB-QB1]
MILNKYLLTVCSLALLISLPQFSQAQQLVNMEETWQEFLSNKKTANISKLKKPDKSQPANYIKYSLIYANTYFCGDNIESAEEMIHEIEAMGKEVWDRVPGFEERYLGLKENMKAYRALDPIWEKFLNNKTSVSKEEVEAHPEAKKICERGTLCKYFYMISHDYFCQKDLEKARDVFDSRIRRLVATTFNPNDIEGLGEEVERMTQFWDAMDELTPAWEAYIETGISPGMQAEMPVIDCYVIPNMKACILKATYDICGVGEKMLDKLKELQKKSTYPIPSIIIDKMDFIEEEVRNIKKDLAIVNTYWKKFTQTGNLPSDVAYKYVFACDREAEVKAYLMDGLMDPCRKGKEALENISKVRKEHKPALASLTMEKLKELKAAVSVSSGDETVLNDAWEDFLPDDALSKNYDLAFEYCDKLAEIKAFIIDGTIHVCEKGQQRLDDIENVLDENEVTIDSETQAKLDALEAKSSKLNAKHEVLNKAWEYLLANDEVSDNYEYDYEFPCNREMDVKAYLLDGYTNPCLSGKYGLTEVDKVMSKHNPKLSDETLAQIKKLRSRLSNEGGNVATLTKAWEDFVPDNKLSGEINFIFSYCDKIAECRAYIMDGIINFCDRGEKRLKDITQLREDYLLTLDQIMEDKLEILYKMVEEGKPGLEGLNKAWNTCISMDDFSKVDQRTIKLAEVYCDPISQTKAWVMKGLMNPCKEGQIYLSKIDYLKRKEAVKYGDELDYQVELLRVNIGKCP